VIAGRKRPLYTDLSAIPESIELAVIAVPAPRALPVVEACAAKGVRAVILLSGGFSEVRETQNLEPRILEIVRRHGMRLIGPNCLGVLCSGDTPSASLNTFFVPEDKFQIDFQKRAKVAILSQSGALGMTEIYNLRNALSPRVIVSYGNQLDVDPGDLVHYLDQDPSIDVIACYIEGFKKGGGRKFFDIAAGVRKPIVVYKAGRTAAGRRATESHTASIAGEYEVAKAAMKQAGLIVADTMIDHGDFIKTFALLSDFEVGGRRVAIIANAGYEKTDAADNLGELEVARFDPHTEDALRAVLPPYVNIEPLLDLTPMAGDETFEHCIRTVLESPQVDALVVSVVPHSILLHTTDEEIARNEEAHLAARIVRLVHRYRKPTLVSVNVAFGAGAVYNRFGQLLDSGGVPTFLTASRAMACLNAFIRYRLLRRDATREAWLK
jgi:acyl-CoA synthetase (NDP forming)